MIIVIPDRFEIKYVCRMNTRSVKILFAFSVVIALLVALSTLVTFSIPNFYAKESANWTVQSIGQDIVDLYFVVPVLLITVLAMLRGSKTSLLLWGGIIAYLVYTYLIYCFALHFNSLFIVYCLILGLCFYAFLYFLYLLSRQDLSSWFGKKTPVKATGIYLIIIAVVFYALWLAQIIPSLAHNTVPKELDGIGLLTNPVHVIDLSVCLPALFIAGVLSIRRHSLGMILAPVMLSFCIIMDITIAFLAFLMNKRGISNDSSVIMIMIILTLLSSTFLVWNLKNMTPPNSSKTE